MDTQITIYRREVPPGKRPPSVRFVAITCFSTVPEVSYWAWLDTGSPFSIIPSFVWEKERAHISLVEGHDWRRIHGISEKQRGAARRERGVPCELGWLDVRLADLQGSRSVPLRIRAQLAKTETVPLILGVADFLDTYELALNRGGESYIVVPGP